MIIHASKDQISLSLIGQLVILNFDDHIVMLLHAHYEFENIFQPFTFLVYILAKNEAL